MGHGIINFLKQTLPRTPITHALHSTPKCYTILTGARLLYFLPTVYYSVFPRHTIGQLAPPLLLDRQYYSVPIKQTTNTFIASK